MDYINITETAKVDEINKQMAIDYADLFTCAFYRLLVYDLQIDIFTTKLTLFNNKTDEIVFCGMAANYPYEWTQIQPIDWATYEINKQLYIDLWADFN